MKRKIFAIIACVLLILVLIAVPVSADPPYQPSNPHPLHGAIGIDINIHPSWTGGDPDGDPVTYDVYFGTISPPYLVVSNQTSTAYDPGVLDYGTTYYWRIIAWDNNNLFNVSPIWNFTTIFNSPPYQPSNPNPANGLTGVSPDIQLNWTGGDPDGDPVTYDVYFGTISPPPVVASNNYYTYYDPGLLNVDTTYYWKITAWDINYQFNTSPIWNFTTRSNTPPDPASNPNPANNSIDLPRDTDLSWTGGDPDPYDSVTYNIYFSTDPNPSIFATSYSSTTFDIPNSLIGYNTQYYWRINTLDSYGAETDGPIWTFTIKEGNPPDTPNNPGPANNSIDVSINTELNWTSSDPDTGDIITYDVHFGTTSPPPMVINNQSADTYDPGTLNPDTTYYWQIKAWDDYGYSSTGPIWTFNTVVNNPPETPSNPNPIDNSVDELTDVDLSWTGGDPDPFDSATYDVFFGTDPNPLLVSTDQTTTTYDPGTLDFDTQYYWRILAEDNFGGSNSSPIWTFRTEVYSNDPPVRPGAPNGPSVGRYLQSHTYTVSTTDPDGDPIYYRFDWDDGQVSKWMGPYVSGREASASHTWLLQGSYGIKVQARDDRFAMSEWSDPLPIMMPRNKLLLHHPLFMFFAKFLEQHPNLFPILRLLLGLYL